jgi:hypothetical protein
VTRFKVVGDYQIWLQSSYLLATFTSVQTLKSKENSPHDHPRLLVMMLNNIKSDRDNDTTQEPNRVRRVKSRYFTRPSRLARSNIPLTTNDSNARRVVRILFKSPTEDYTFVREIPQNHGTVIWFKKALPCLALLRESYCLSPLRTLEAASNLCHPNIADIRDAYYHEEKLYIVSEYLEVSLLDVDFNLYPLEEWEIATIISEVRRKTETISISAN